MWNPAYGTLTESWQKDGIGDHPAPSSNGSPPKRTAISPGKVSGLPDFRLVTVTRT